MPSPCELVRLTTGRTGTLMVASRGTEVDDRASFYGVGGCSSTGSWILTLFYVLI